MTLELHLDDAALIEPAVQDLCAAGGSPTGAVARALQAQVFERLRGLLGDRLLKPPRIQPDIGPGAGGPATLPELAKTGYEVYYTELRFSTRSGDTIEGMKVSGGGIEIIPLYYGSGVYRATQFKSKTLKQQINHELRINQIRVPGKVFQAVLKELMKPNTVQQPWLPNFQPSPGIQGFHTVSYDHILTGQQVFCSCAKAMHQHRLAEARALAPQYVPGSWPQQYVSIFERAKYVDDICHLCIARKYSPEEAARFYGAGVNTGFVSFLDQVMFDLGMDRKTARAEVMQLLGLSRWKREAQLFQLVRELFPDQRVLREASPDWLGRMRLDIYLPELQLALEHQGEQHYRPIGAFGGEEAHARVVERDALKRHLCQANGVEVLDVRFDAPISRAALRQRLQRYL